MIINFVFPGNRNISIGGYKLAFQYANELSSRGHKVHLSFVERLASPKINPFKATVIKVRNSLIGQVSKQVTWFKLNADIELHYDVVTINDVPDADCIIATGAPTATFISLLPKSKGKGYYFIQNYEKWWFESVEQLNDTYRLGLTNIVISPELVHIVELATGKEPIFIPNFYDHKEFFLEKAIGNRDKRVAMLYHVQETKRSKFGLKVLEDVKKEVPDLKVELFGAFKPDFDLPGYVHFTYKATSEQLRTAIYGLSQIYFMPTVLEGWSLTGMEAMASGAAIVASRIGGMPYLTDENSLLVTPDQGNKFKEALISLLQNQDRRVAIAKKGLTDVQSYSVQKSTDLFEKAIKF
jgi:glycosyltransferase involved in cell wall biosynthesis